MDTITITHNGNEYRVRSSAFDRVIMEYLPASPNELRKRCEERANMDYSDIRDVSVFLGMLADWDYNVDSSPYRIY